MAPACSWFDSFGTWHISRKYIRFRSVSLWKLFRRIETKRIYQIYNFSALFCFAWIKHRHCKPDSCMSILTAVFTDSLRVSSYITCWFSVFQRKRRRKQTDNSVFTVNQQIISSFNCRFCIFQSCKNWKCLRKNINKAFIFTKLFSIGKN